MLQTTEVENQHHLLMVEIVFDVDNFLVQVLNDSAKRRVRHFKERLCKGLYLRTVAAFGVGAMYLGTQR